MIQNDIIQNIMIMILIIIIQVIKNVSKSQLYKMIS